MSRADMLKTLSYLETLWKGVRKAKAEGKTLEQALASLTLKDRFPEVASWRDERNRGKYYQELDIHKHNIEFLWNVRDTPRVIMRLGLPSVPFNVPGCLSRVIAHSEFKLRHYPFFPLMDS